MEQKTKQLNYLKHKLISLSYLYQPDLLLYRVGDDVTLQEQPDAILTPLYVILGDVLAELGEAPSNPPYKALMLLCGMNVSDFARFVGVSREAVNSKIMPTSKYTVRPITYSYILTLLKGR